MGTKDINDLIKGYELSKEEEELIGIAVKTKNDEVKRNNRYAKFHKWGKQGVTTKSHFRIVKRKSDRLFYDWWEHGNLNGYGDDMALYPGTKTYNTVCTCEFFNDRGYMEDEHPDNTCKTCRDRIAFKEIVKSLKEFGTKESITLAARFEKMLTNTRAKAKKGWIAVTQPKNKDDSYKVEPYKVSGFIFNRDINETLVEKKLNEIGWKEEHPEVESLSDVEQSLLYIKNAEPKRKLPHDIKGGWTILVTKSGFGVEVIYHTEFGKNAPLVKGTPDYEVMKAAIEADEYPDYPSFIKPLTLELHERLCGDVNVEALDEANELLNGTPTTEESTEEHVAEKTEAVKEPEVKKVTKPTVVEEMTKEIKETVEVTKKGTADSKIEKPKTVLPTIEEPTDDENIDDMMF